MLKTNRTGDDYDNLKVFHITPFTCSDSCEVKCKKLRLQSDNKKRMERESLSPISPTVELRNKKFEELMSEQEKADKKNT